MIYKNIKEKFYAKVNLSKGSGDFNLIPWFFVVVQFVGILKSYTNLQILDQQQNQLILNLNLLQNNINDLNLELINKDFKITELIKLVNTIQVTPNNIQLHNDMIQFYIIAAGISIAAVVALVVISNAYPSLFSIQAIIPGNVYKFLQDYTPLFQNKEIYSFDDEDLTWVITLLNRKHVDVKIKTNQMLDFVSAPEHIQSLNTQIQLLNMKIVEITAMEETTLVAYEQLLQEAINII